MSRKIEKYSNI